MADQDADSLDDPPATPRMTTYTRGVRTALRQNASAYGFSISITVSYGLVSGPRSSITAGQTIAFGAGAALAFVVVGAVFVAVTSRGSLPESRQALTFSGGVDLLSVAAAIAAGYGLSQITGPWAWPLTGAGTVTCYLLVGGMDVLIARAAARRTRFGSDQ